MPKAPPKSRKMPRNAILSASVADMLYSHLIRTRDKFCQFPNCMVSDPAKLTASHYIGRGKWATRFDPNNSIALCRIHHYWDKQLGWEFQKQRAEVHGWDGQYTLHMKKRLGKTRYKGLIKKSQSKNGARHAALLAFTTFVKANPELFPMLDIATLTIRKVS